MVNLLVFVVLLAVSLIPGAVGWWLYRRLDTGADDDTLLSERLKIQQWLGTVFWVCAFSVILVAYQRPAAYLVLAPMLLGIVFANWIGRRRLYGETWGFWPYAWFLVRFFLAFLTPTLLLIVTPSIVLAAPSSWLAAAIATLGLLVVFHTYHLTMPWILGSRPWRPEGALAARFAEIEGRAELDWVATTRLIPVGAGRIYNAFAVPHPRKARVLFTSALIDSFPDDQIAGIHAHEISHLEQFRRPRVLWTLEVFTLLLIACAGFGVPFLAADRIDGWVVPLLWSLVILLLHVLRTRWIHGLESEADQRAVHLLGGDGESLAAGLEELHKRQRMPRRLSAELERKMTHPSLARRLQSIRRLSGRRPDRSDAEDVFRSPDGSSALIFDRERLHRLSGLPDAEAQQPDDLLSSDHLRQAAASSRSDAYSVLTELRLVQDAHGPQLSGTHVDGSSFTCPVSEDDTPQIAAWLDSVDGDLADLPKQSLVGRKSITWDAVFGMILSLSAIGAFPAALLTGIFLLVTRHRAAAAAFSVASAGAAFTLVRDLVADPGTFGLLSWASLAVLVWIALTLASYARSPAAPNGSPWKGALTCLGCGATGLVFLCLAAQSDSGISVFVLSNALFHLPSVWVLLLCAAAALATVATRPARGTAWVLLLLGCGLAALSLGVVRQVLVPDPLFRAWSPRVPTVELVEIDRWSIPTDDLTDDPRVDANSAYEHDFYDLDFRAAPDGTWVAVQSWRSEAGDLYGGETQWTLTPRGGSADEQVRLIEGRLEFLGPDAALHHTDSSPPVLIRFDLASGERKELAIDSALFDLSVDDRGSWQITGFEQADGVSRYVRLSGDASSFETGEMKRVSAPNPHSAAEALTMPSSWVLLDDRMIYVVSRWRTNPTWIPLMVSLGLDLSDENRVRQMPLSDDGDELNDDELKDRQGSDESETLLTTRLDITCPSQRVFSRDLFCLADDRNLNRLVRIRLGSKGEDPEVAVLATVPRDSWTLDLSYGAGWVLLKFYDQSLLWQAASERLYRVPESPDQPDALWDLTSSEGSNGSAKPLLMSLSGEGELALYDFAIPNEP